MEAPPATTPFSHPVDEYDECWSRHDVTQNASGDFQSVRTIGMKSFGAPYCLQGHEGAWQLLPETRGSPPLPPLNWHQRHRRGANATPALEGTGWSLMVLSQQGRLFDSRLEYNMSSAGTLRSSSVVCRHVCQSGHRKKAYDAVTRQQRHTRSARPSAWKHRSFSKWRLTERPACLSPPSSSAHMNTGWLLHAGALLLGFRRNFDMCGNSSFNGTFPSRERLRVDCSQPDQARRQRGTALAVRKWLRYTKWIQIWNCVKPFLHPEWRTVAVPGFLLCAVPEIQILRRKSTTNEMGKYALPSSPVQVELRSCFGSSVCIKCCGHVGWLSGYSSLFATQQK